MKGDLEEEGVRKEDGREEGGKEGRPYMLAPRRPGLYSP
jgi:hypothetical protein